MSLQTTVRIARDGAEPLVLLVVLGVLHHFGLLGAVPLWVVVAFLLTGVILQQQVVQVWLSGGDLSRRIWPRVSTHVAQSTVLMYLTGWGAVPVIAHVLILSVHLRQSGSRAWQPAAAASAASIAAGQACYATGVLQANVPMGLSHAVAALMASAVVVTARVLGTSVAQREVAEASLRRSEEHFRALVRDGTEVIMEASADGSVTYVSPAARPVLGYRPAQLLGKVVPTLIHPDDKPGIVEMYARLMAGDGAAEHHLELRLRHADDEWRWYEMTARNMLGHPAVQAIIVRYRDVTERRITQERLAYAATHDSLTGLANAPTLGRDLERALAQGTRYQHAVGLLFLDLDGFKPVNDTYGHDVGDRLLQSVGRVLRATVRDTDTVGRVGGDEFAVVLTRVGGTDEALSVARRIIDGIAGDSEVAGVRLEVGCSVGVALAHPGGTDAHTMMRHADAAMYEAKRNGRNGVRLWEPTEVTAPWLGG
ncbi:sensor domain-containing diguanylate cyclase [Mangrovihabitans endophyticus]|uniref:PAS domain S-box-containing protein/diguanylate cyclase (GGDEF) domain-containing protein n=1 Tax=Mangrovihabitans endophyticus TaxID=1751298 RepID=A0A8J3C4L2_9ACTN|nr:sensor domain-containing diguanylate cyclase [Mangrovihabitans endophyticus]GGL17058.1 hypothetical protein GCM10012284_59560 [Mangrovihabitans endophyticus]